MNKKNKNVTGSVELMPTRYKEGDEVFFPLEFSDENGTLRERLGHGYIECESVTVHGAYFVKDEATRRICGPFMPHRLVPIYF